jgi:hypothetical protein
MRNAIEGRVVGRVPFMDGVNRDGYEDPEGRQWVIGYCGERVYVVWLKPSEQPETAERGRK